jgi:hypothetical protein
MRLFGIRAVLDFDKLFQYGCIYSFVTWGWQPEQIYLLNDLYVNK